MAHPCFSCGSECYCHGDIDDIIVSKTPANCDSCGCANDEDLDEDDNDEIPIGFYCLGCGSEFEYPVMGCCPHCTGSAIDEIYF